MTRLEPMDSADRSPEFQEQGIVAQLKAGDLRCMGLLVDHFGEDLMDYLLAILGKHDPNSQQQPDLLAPQHCCGSAVSVAARHHGLCMAEV